MSQGVEAIVPLWEGSWMLSEIPFGSPEYDEAIGLRDLVLRQPLKLQFTPEQIGEEWDSLHLGIYQSGGPLLGCLTLKPVQEGVWKMRQVAVHPDWQGKGLGRLLVQFAENHLIRIGANRIELHARDTAVPFYQAQDYLIYDAPFYEVGIPHRAMRKDLQK